VDLVRDVAEVAPAGELLGIPVVGQLDLRGLVTGRREEDQRVAPGLVLVASELLEPELVAVEVERFLEVRDSHHRVQVLHVRRLPRTGDEGRASGVVSACRCVRARGARAQGAFGGSVTSLARLSSRSPRNTG